MKITVIIVSILFTFNMVFAGERVYTDEDLKKYNIGYGQEKTINSGGHVEINNSSLDNPSIDEVKLSDTINLKLQGCPTLQDSIDNKGSAVGGVQIKLLRKGRSIEEICNTIGVGCRVCKEIK